MYTESIIISKTRDESKVHKCPRPLLFAHMATPSWCIHSKSYFPNAQIDLLYILIPSPTPEHEPGATLAQRWRFRPG